jgi:hypothetical protein
VFSRQSRCRASQKCEGLQVAEGKQKGKRDVNVASGVRTSQ